MDFPYRIKRQGAKTARQDMWLCEYPKARYEIRQGVALVDEAVGQVAVGHLGIGVCLFLLQQTGKPILDGLAFTVGKRRAD